MVASERAKTDDKEKNCEGMKRIDENVPNGDTNTGCSTAIHFTSLENDDGNSEQFVDEK